MITEFKRLLVGNPIEIAAQHDQCPSKRMALAVFPNGVVAALLAIAFNARTQTMLPLYAIGVFISFTLAQFRMVRHWLREREPGWQHSVAVKCAISSRKSIDDERPGKRSCLALAYIDPAAGRYRSNQLADDLCDTSTVRKNHDF